MTLKKIVLIISIIGLTASGCGSPEVSFQEPQARSQTQNCQWVRSTAESPTFALANVGPTFHHFQRIVIPAESTSHHFSQLEVFGQIRGEVDPATIDMRVRVYATRTDVVRPDLNQLRGEHSYNLAQSTFYRARGANALSVETQMQVIDLSSMNLSAIAGEALWIGISSNQDDVFSLYYRVGQTEAEDYYSDGLFIRNAWEDRNHFIENEQKEDLRFSFSTCEI